ncbi:hypothetical protein EG829_28825, partial [bacterium]|nr:hypothetical protein [bacterium]
MGEPVRGGLRVVDPANTPSDSLEVRDIVTCWLETLRGRAVLLYDFQETRRRRALPDEFHLRELMDLDVSQPGDVAEFCSSYGLPETSPFPTPWGDAYTFHSPLVRGSLDLLAPELIEECNEVSFDEAPWMTAKLRFLEYTGLRLHDRLAQPPLILQDDSDREVLEGMRARGVRWAVAVDLACVATALAFLKDMVRRFLVSAGALSCDEMMSVLEPRRHAFIRQLLVEDDESVIAEIARETQWWPALLDAIRRVRNLGFYRDLENPERGPESSYTLSRLADFINEGLNSVPLQVAVHATDYPELAHTPGLTLKKAIGVSLYRDLASPRLQ